MAVTKSGRHLVVLSNLATTSRRYKQLYQFLDSSTLPVTQVVCGRAYATVSEPEDGSLAAFIRAVRAATTAPEIEAVDLVLACHGVNSAIKFTEGKQPLTAMETAFGGMPNRHKLRLAYDLCCFGASHSAGLHRIGSTRWSGREASTPTRRSSCRPCSAPGRAVSRSALPSRPATIRPIARSRTPSPR